MVPRYRGDDRGVGARSGYGWNPYKSFWEVVAEKSGAIAGWDGGSPACWWGIMFEDVAARFIEIDCGTTIYGEEICIQAIKGHRNSPDGYAVIGMYREEVPTGAGYEWRIWTTDRTTPPEVYYIVLIETKCPYQRFPDSKVPRQYKPQVWSGLVVSPICHFGLFADFVFRRCSIANLGPNTAYDTIYHMYDRRALGFPFAWGLTGVYAPTIDAPINLRIKGAKELSQEELDADEDSFGEFGAPRAADASLEAWHIYTSYFGMSIGTEARSRDVIDFGDCQKNTFDKAMSLISTKAFLTEHTDPCFADGRGADLHLGKEIGGVIDHMRNYPPADHYYLLGVIPWKLFKADYVPLERQVGFRQTLTETVDKVQAIATAARESGNPVEYIRAQRELEVPPSQQNAQNLRASRSHPQCQRPTCRTSLTCYRSRRRKKVASGD